MGERKKFLLHANKLFFSCYNNSIFVINALNVFVVNRRDMVELCG